MSYLEWCQEFSQLHYQYINGYTNEYVYYPRESWIWEKFDKMTPEQGLKAWIKENE